MSEFYRNKWKEIHLNAAKVLKKIWTHRDFCEWMYTVPDSLPCSSCRRHAKDYIERYPPEKAENALKWSLDFHNDVNQRLKKPLYQYETLLKKHGL